MVKHWIDKRIEDGKDWKLQGNYPRISAPTLVKLLELKNELRGFKRSIYEEALISEELNQQVI